MGASAPFFYLDNGVLMKKLLLTMFLFVFHSFPVQAEEYYAVGWVRNGGEKCFTSGQIVPRSFLYGAERCQIQEGSYSCEFNSRNNVYKCGSVSVASLSRLGVCPEGYKPDSTGACKPENECAELKGEKLGTVTFPDGTRDVATLCRNSCQAKSDLFFPAANPPYGIFTYTGEACDGSESSGGGETGGGETGGGETGGGETGGGETGGGETGGGETGGGSNNGDGLTKAQLQDTLQSFFGKSGSFTKPVNGDGYVGNTVMSNSIGLIEAEVEQLEKTLESTIKQSPLKLGQMSFSDGSYESTTFSLSRWNVDVGFNLFSSLGSNNTNMIRTVILFIATLLAGFILLSSGRSKV